MSEDERAELMRLLQGNRQNEDNAGVNSTPTDANGGTGLFAIDDFFDSM